MKCPHHPGHDLNPDSGICALCASDLPIGDEIASDGEAEPKPPFSVVPLPTRAQRASEEEAGADAGPTATSAKSGETDDEVQFFDELRRIRELKLYAILFFGFRTAGKTWLLDRVKRELLYGQGINCSPPFQPVTGKTKDLPGSTKIEFHRVQARPRAFVLIDIPGEAAEDLMSGKREDLRMLLSAMDYADATIIALPADIVLLGDQLPASAADLRALAKPKGKAEEASPKTIAKLNALVKAMRIDSNRLELFTAGLSWVVGLLSYFREHGIDPSDKAAFDRVNIADVVDHITVAPEPGTGRGERRYESPTFFALTKADRVLALLRDRPSDPQKIKDRNRDIRARPEAWLLGRLLKKVRESQILDDLTDPWEDVQKSRTALHGQLISAFPLAKFDYVTAFYGHDGSTKLTREHYDRHPERGVLDVVSWIRKAQRLGPRASWWLHPYSLASRARRYLANLPLRQRFDLIRRDAK